MKTAHQYFKIVIIGAGNVANHLAKRLKKERLLYTSNCFAQ